jgi:hypothetical protein
MLACYCTTLSPVHEHAAAKPAMEHTASDDSNDENECVDSTTAAAELFELGCRDLDREKLLG